MPDVTAVLFDYGLVLTGPPDPGAWERLKAVLEAEEASFHASYWRFRHDYDRGSLRAPAYWCEVAAKDLRADELRELIEADTALWTQPNLPMIDWAARLQRGGMKTGILSNIGDAMEAGVRERCAWLNGFAHLTFSHALGMAKPEVAIYGHAAEGLDTPPENILFIDDRADNIAAAEIAGMQTAQYTEHDAFLQAMRSKGLGYLLEI